MFFIFKKRIPKDIKIRIYSNMAFKMKVLLICICVLVLLTMSSADERVNQKKSRKKRFIEFANEFPGPYCETRPGQKCCPGRDDSCTVPILGTLCYCDIFCNETADDCCPDFWRYCMGVQPIRQACVRDQVSYPPGAVVKDNCNECTCSPDPRAPSRHSFRCTNNLCLIQPNVVRSVNDNPRYGWRAANYSQFWGMTLDQGKRYRLGTMPPENQVMRMIPIQMEMEREPPRSFDARQKWPNYIHPVRDQGNCGASWAFSTAAVASDRLAIESEGILTEELSAQHLLSCNTARGQLGCNGGYLDKAWWFLRQHGLVTDECYPYQSGYYNSRDECRMPLYSNRTRCPNGRNNYPERILKSTPPYRISQNEKEIMMEIMKNGPVQATMKVKNDFFMYRSGIYRHTNQGGDFDSDRNNGYHSVRIIGWGEERINTGENMKYWLCSNSWGTKWGENGLFRIQRSKSNCEIETFVVGAFKAKYANDEYNEDALPDESNNIYTWLPPPGLVLPDRNYDYPWLPQPGQGPIGEQGPSGRRDVLDLWNKYNGK